MDGHRHIDAMNDPSLDREIESMLAAEPSPEFVARVRARVAAEPEPGRWHVSWIFAVGGAVAVVIVALLAWPSREPAPRIAADPVRPQGHAPLTPSTGPQVVPQAPLRARTAVALASVRNRVMEIDLPEVVIADNEVRTFATLVESIRASRFDAAVPAAPDLITPLEVKELPPVEPLEIEPIVKLATLE
jgi:hypothetical protein